MKDYDSTLARMAGNIAAGLVQVSTLIKSDAEKAGVHERIAETSVDLAERIIAKAKARYAALPAESLQK